MASLVLILISTFLIVCGSIANVAENIQSISAWASLIGVIVLIIAVICFIKDE